VEKEDGQVAQGLRAIVAARALEQDLEELDGVACGKEEDALWVGCQVRMMGRASERASEGE
jgi:hypothetical protein